jgi:hypothetical protein
MKNLSRHTDHLCELVTSLLMREIQVGEMSELGWLIGLVKRAIWVDTLYFHACSYCQFPKYKLHPSLPYDPLRRHVELILIFIEDPL